MGERKQTSMNSDNSEMGISRSDNCFGFVLDRFVNFRYIMGVRQSLKMAEFMEIRTGSISVDDILYRNM